MPIRRRRAPVKTAMKALMAMMRKPRARVGGRRRVARRSGRGILDSIKSGLSSVNNFLRDNRLISRGLRMIPGKYSAPLATLADTAGYGRRRAPARRRRGGMMLSPPFMGGRRRVGGRVVFPAVYTTGLGGLSATTA
jgi:hypothetical protein